MKKSNRKSKNISFKEREPELNSYVCIVWKDGSCADCIYTGLDKSILPLPTHWYYIYYIK